MKTILMTLTLALTTLPLFAAKLAWDANTETDLKGYKIYQGIASRTYTQTFDVGNVLEFPLKNLTPKTTYYFAVTAYNTTGLESDYSVEIKYTPLGIPLNPRIIPTAPTAGGTALIQNRIWNTDNVVIRITGRELAMSNHR